MLLEFGILAALGAMLFWGFGDFLIQKSTRKFGDIESLAFIGIVGSIGILPFIINDLYLLFIPGNFVLLFFLGILTFLVSVINFEALKKGKISVVEVILEIELPITIVLGFFLLRESLSYIQLGLIGLIFLGIVMISLSPESLKKHKKKIEKGVILSVITATGMAFINFFTAVGSRDISPFMIIWFPWIMFSIITLVLVSKRDGGLRRFCRDAKRFRNLIIPMGILDTGAWIFFSLAVMESPLAITIAITESYPAIAMLLGLSINKERISKRQFLGVFLSIAGSLALAFI